MIVAFILNKISQVTLPQSLEVLGDSAFSWCSKPKFYIDEWIRHCGPSIPTSLPNDSLEGVWVKSNYKLKSEWIKV